MRRLLVVTGSRADFGLWRPVLEAAQRHPELEPRLLVTAMHLEPQFGATVQEVRASGYEIAAEVPCTPEADDPASMPAAVGRAVVDMAPLLGRERPDWLLVLGDRGEQLAAVIAAMHLPIAIAHVAGGDVTLGAIDDTVRDMITRASHLHLATSDAAADRLRRLGEEAWRIRVVGSPGLDDLPQLAAAEPGPVLQRYGLPTDGPYLVLLQHPETRAARDPVADLDATLTATAELNLPRIAILPNADAGGRAMIERLQAEPDLPLIASAPRGDFAVLLARAAALVGNSSSGLTEAPLLGVPAVDIGDRQAGRLRGDNVVHAEADSASIAQALQVALSPGFRSGLSGRSPHGDGRAAQRIVSALTEQSMGPELLRKRSGQEAPDGG